MAAAMTATLAVPAAAANAASTDWYPYNTYDLFDQCPPDGQFGLQQGWWLDYYCDYGGGQTILWVLLP